MKNKRFRNFWLVSGILGLTALLLLLNLLAAQEQTAYAHDAQNQALQTGGSPREILANNPCSQLNEPNAHSITMTNEIVERIRFGDEKSHYFKFWGKSGNWYKINTHIFDGPQVNPVIGVDTMVSLYHNNPLENSNEQAFQVNDDKSFTSTISSAYEPYESEIKFQATADQYYWIKVENRVENGNGTYCLGIKFDTDRTTGNKNRPDTCEDNNLFDRACEIDLWEIKRSTDTSDPQPPPYPSAPLTPTTILYNFKPLLDSGKDLDFYKVWVKQGERYVCETYNLSQVNDTRMILYTNGGAELGRNDDVTPNDNGVTSDDRRSKVSVTTGYSGWLYILVEPVVDVDFDLAHLYTYQLKCDGTVDLAPIDSHIPPVKPTWDATLAPNNSLQVEPETIVEAIPTSTSIPAALAKPAVVSFAALPARTPTPEPQQAGLPTSFTVQIYYDQNNNQLKDDDEGVANIPIYLYMGLTNDPMYMLTSEGGAVFIKTATASGSVQLVVPYLNINQELSVNGIQDVRLKIASQ